MSRCNSWVMMQVPAERGRFSIMHGWFSTGFRMHWLEKKIISSETLISGQMFAIKIQFWFNLCPLLPSCISARSGGETRVFREGRSELHWWEVLSIGLPWECWDAWKDWRMLRDLAVFAAEPCFSSHRSWVNKNSETERTAHGDGRQHEAVPEGLFVFFLWISAEFL